MNGSYSCSLFALSIKLIHVLGVCMCTCVCMQGCMVLESYVCLPKMYVWSHATIVWISLEWYHFISDEPRNMLRCVSVTLRSSFINWIIYWCSKTIPIGCIIDGVWWDKPAINTRRDSDNARKFWSHMLFKWLVPSYCWVSEWNVCVGCGWGGGSRKRGHRKIPNWLLYHGNKSEVQFS